MDFTVGLVQPNGPEVPPSKLGLNLGAVSAEASVEAALGIKAGFAAGRAKTVSGALGVNGALNLAAASVPGLPACKLSVVCAGAGVGAEASLDLTSGAPTLKFTSTEKSPGRSDTKSYTIEDRNAVRRIITGTPNYLAQLALSILTNDRLLRLLADPGALADLGISRVAGSAALADPTPIVAGNQLDLIFSLLRSLGDGLRINTEETSTESSQITVPIGARVRLGPATLGVGLSIEGSSAFDFTRRRGTIVGLREFLLEEYDEEDEFIAQQSVLETADAILQNAVDRAGETLVTLRDTVRTGVPAALSNVQRRIRLLFTPVANGAVTVSSWPAAGTSGQTGNARLAAKSLSFVGPTQETFEAIGHVHNIQSDEGVLGSGTLELDYTDAELAGADEPRLQIARFDAAAAQFVFLQTSVDAAANRASATIDRMGQYALFKRLDLGCPSLEAIDAEAALLRLRFTAITHPAITGYNIYRATLFDDAFDLLTPTPVAGAAFEDRGIDGNTLYRYRVTGVTSTGGETCASNTRTNDADADGLADQFEVAFGFSTSRDDAGDDPDGDGLINVDEQGLGTDPLRADSDGDGLSDGEEVMIFGTDPRSADSDGDGLDDGEEVMTFGTDPLRADSDGDGLSDGEEVMTFGTDPLRADSDG
ncbi:MAG: hypothetical protein HYU28_12785, partial [Actinobacteria bacterium]|nr:hypothetical protein [Actinomycetota bacterium]